MCFLWVEISAKKLNPVLFLASLFDRSAMLMPSARLEYMPWSGPSVYTWVQGASGSMQSRRDSLIPNTLQLWVVNICDIFGTRNGAKLKLWIDVDFPAQGQPRDKGIHHGQDSSQEDGETRRSCFLNRFLGLGRSFLYHRGELRHCRWDAIKNMRNRLMLQGLN